LTGPPSLAATHVTGFGQAGWLTRSAPGIDLTIPGRGVETSPWLFTPNDAGTLR
jgi:hypothetical protein